MDGLKKTPLYDIHIKYGARIIDFGGWALPVQYAGIISEHQAVRNKAGLFDVSHMGEIRVSGSGALSFIQSLITNDAAKLSLNQIVYSPVCLPEGGIVDDILVYRLGENDYLLVVNAANREKDLAWIKERAAGFTGVDILDLSDDMAQLALQGPLSVRILSKLGGTRWEEIKYYWARQDVAVAGVNCLVSRTGYTGEDGFELYCRPDKAPLLWEELVGAGGPEGLVPAGLGARDTLRLEAAMPLYGNDLNQATSPLEAGLGRFVCFTKGDFCGREALKMQEEKGAGRVLAGFELTGQGIPRHGYAIFAQEKEIGEVTSGTFSPTLGKALGLGYVPAENARLGGEVEVVIRSRSVPARIVRTPFYRREN